MTHRILLRAVLLAALTAAACDSSATGPETPAQVASVTVSSLSSSLLPGDSIQLQAVARASDGAVLPGRAVAWSTDAPSVATVSPTGMLRALTDGTVRVQATVDGKAGSRDVTVAPHSVASVSVEPFEISLVRGAALQLAAVVRAQDGRVLEGRNVSWQSDDATVAVVSPGGRLVGMGTGETRITATAEGRTGEAWVSVSAPPGYEPGRRVVLTPSALTVQVGKGVLVYADVVDSLGVHLPQGRIDGWRSQDTTVARVTSTGVVWGIAPGFTRIYARSGDVEGFAQVLVTGPTPHVPGAYRLHLYPGDGMTAIDTIDWNDPNGGVVRAALFVRGSALTLRPAESRYVQSVALDLVGPNGVYLGRLDHTQEGAIAYTWPGASYTLVPDGGAAPVFGATVLADGRLRVEQSFRGEARRFYTFVPVQQ